MFSFSLFSSSCGEKLALQSFPNTGKGKFTVFFFFLTLRGLLHFSFQTWVTISHAFLPNGQMHSQSNFLGSRVNCTTRTVQSFTFCGNLGLVRKSCCLCQCKNVSSTFEDGKQGIACCSEIQTCRMFSFFKTG